jgi:septal ring factor EnvC (AmiA/AmiB activator)
MSLHSNRAKKLRIKLGIPHGLASPLAVARARLQHKLWNEANPQKMHLYRDKYEQKRGNRRLERYLFSTQQQKKKLFARKKRANDAIEELHKLQKVSKFYRNSFPRAN